jgi:hypothetical protein
MCRLSAISLIFAAALIACEAEKSNQRSRPTDETEDISGYLESTERDVSPDDTAEVILGKTQFKIPAGSASSGYKFRVSIRSDAPELAQAESVGLGDPKAEVVDIELFESSTNVVLSSTDLLQSYEFKQSFAHTGSTNNLGLMVVSDYGSAAQQSSLLPSSELVFESGLSLMGQSELTVRVNLKLTKAVLWLVSYTDDAIKNLVLGTASSVSSVGGNPSSVITTGSQVNRGSIKIDGGESYTNSTNVDLELGLAGAAEMYVTNKARCDGGGSWESYNGTKSWTLSSTNTVNRVYVKFRSIDGGETSCVSDSIIHDDISPSAPTSLNYAASNESLLASPSLSWNASSDAGSGISYYEIAIGTSSGATDVKTWTAVGDTTSSMISGLNLTSNLTYYASIRAGDAAGNKSDVAAGDGWTATGPTINCPSNFVAIPANSDLGTAAFCVMKYEAKLVGLGVTSQAAGAPWTSIARGADPTSGFSAWKACKDAGLDLLSNAQWQAIARNIESVASNWSNGNSTGTNSLNRGNSNGSAALAADDSDANGCFGITSNGDPDDNCGNAWHVNKRTHNLSNGQII